MRNMNKSLLVISIDLESSKSKLTFAHQRELRQTCAELVQLFDRFQVPATWAISDPTNDFLRSLFAENSVSHELAIQGTALCQFDQSDRASFAGRLSETIAQAKCHALQVHSLVGLNVDSANTDLLVKNDISVLRTGGNQVWTTPQPVRFGVWNLPESCFFPGARNWLNQLRSSRFQKLVRTAAAKNRTMHMVVKAESVSQSRDAHFNNLSQLLECAAKYRQAGQLTTATLHDSVRLLTNRPTRSSTKSVLRAA